MPYRFGSKAELENYFKAHPTKKQTQKALIANSYHSGKLTGQTDPVPRAHFCDPICAG